MPTSLRPEGGRFISTPIAEAFEARGGVCQDFAHIMIAGLRGLGLPACYVSGYIRTARRKGSHGSKARTPRTPGCGAWCGEGIGWLGLDPTNGLQVNAISSVVAVGRDYSDVAPLVESFWDFRQADAEGERGT